MRDRLRVRAISGGHNKRYLKIGNGGRSALDSPHFELDAIPKMTAMARGGA